MALAGEADLLAVVDSGRNLDLERSLLDDPARALALPARMLDHAACTAAARARLRADELAEGRPRDVLEPAGAVAGRATRWLGTGLGAAAAAGRARHGHRKRNIALRSAGSLGEVDLDPSRDIRSARPAGTARDAEEIVSEERREEIGEAAEVEARRGEAATAQAVMAVAVVELARLGLREDLVGLDHLAEPLLRVRLL